MIGITGASGQLGRQVIEQLLESVPGAGMVALVRDPAAVRDLAAAGVQIRHADYDRPETLAAALAGIDKLLLISSNAIGRRTAQHRAVIEAARQAGVRLIAYTSILHADSSPLPLAVEHRETEALLRASGIDHVLLRNGWYTENYLASVPAALQHSVLLGAAGEGRIASAARADYARAAAAVLTRADQAGKIYELAGDEAYTLAGFAETLAGVSGKPVSYQDLAPAAFEAAMLEAGLPQGLAKLLAESDRGAARGGLLDEDRQLSRLIGRPTTPLAKLIAAALA